MPVKPDDPKNRNRKLPLQRRNFLFMNYPSEIAIRKAMFEVEQCGADEKLTEIIILLERANNLLSDYLDEQIK